MTNQLAGVVPKKEDWRKRSLPDLSSLIGFDCIGPF